MEPDDEPDLADDELAELAAALLPVVLWPQRACPELN